MKSEVVLGETKGEGTPSLVAYPCFALELKLRGAQSPGPHLGHTHCHWRVHKALPAVACAPRGRSHTPVLLAHTNLRSPAQE